MNNLEKNKNDLLLVGTDFMVNKQGKVYGCRTNDCEDCIFWKYPNTYEDSDIVECEHKRMEWLMDECKEPILDSMEKEILRDVIKSFRATVSYITRIKTGIGLYCVRIVYQNDCAVGNVDMPLVKNKDWCGDMELGKHYKLEELDL